MSFDDDGDHVLINSKYFDVNELNAIATKENHFGILHLNTASLNKHIDSLSNVFRLIKFNFKIFRFERTRNRTKYFSQ